jgi:hypothetical protein
MIQRICPLVLIALGLASLMLMPVAPVLAQTLQITCWDSGSGTLNGVPFPTSNFVITSYANPANKQWVTGGIYSMDHMSSSISIAGLGNFDILTGTRTFLDTSPASPRVGFSRAGLQGLDLLLGPQNQAFQTWDMVTPIGPLTGDTWGLEQWTRTPLIDTTGGVLIFNDGGGHATFAAAVVPEPAGLLIGAFGLPALCLRPPRRSHQS